MFEKTKEALYRFHILSSTYSNSIVEHGENCNLQVAAHNELGNALKLVEGQKPTTNRQIMPCTCKPVPASMCLQRQLYVDDNCPQHGRTA